MRYTHIVFFLLLFSLNFYSLEGDTASGAATLFTDNGPAGVSAMEANAIFAGLQGDVDSLPFTVFKLGYAGYRKLLDEGEVPNGHILTLIDFTRASREKRLWVIDLDNASVLFHEWVAHGKNSGLQYATTFSNAPETNMSSLGFYVTGGTYVGKHGRSLVLNGMEKNFNGNARKRSIVMHPASYVSRNFIERYGRIGRSFGCPAIPEDVSAGLIDAVKGGTCLFIYYPDREYLRNSGLIGRGAGAVSPDRDHPGSV